MTTKEERCAYPGCGNLRKSHIHDHSICDQSVDHFDLGCHPFQSPSQPTPECTDVEEHMGWLKCPTHNREIMAMVQGIASRAPVPTPETITHTASEEVMCACETTLDGMKHYTQSMEQETKRVFVRVTKHRMSGCVDEFHRWGTIDAPEKEPETLKGESLTDTDVDRLYSYEAALKRIAAQNATAEITLRKQLARLESDNAALREEIERLRGELEAPNGDKHGDCGNVLTTDCEVTFRCIREPHTDSLHVSPTGVEWHGDSDADA